MVLKNAFISFFLTSTIILSLILYSNFSFAKELYNKSSQINNITLKNKSEPTNKSTNTSSFNLETKEIIINYKTYQLGGVSLENSKINEIKKLTSSLKNELDKKSNITKKKDKYLIHLPKSYQEIDEKICFDILSRIGLDSISKFKILYLPHLKQAKKIKNNNIKQSKSKDELDNRTKMACWIIGNFINEVIEKYGGKEISKRHKDFNKWIDEGANILSYGTIYPGKLSKKKHKEIIDVKLSKKILKAIIEVESNGIHLKNGKFTIGLNKNTFPNIGSYVIGFMQESVVEFAHGINLFDPEINIKNTCKKLHKLLIKYNGDYNKVLRCYNAGEGNSECEQAYNYLKKINKKMEKYLN